MHKRAAIRDAVVAALLAVPALAGRVDKSRVRRTQDNELPVVLVYALQEQSQAITLGRRLQRNLSLVVEVRVAATTTLDDQVDELCALVEVATAADPTFGGLAMNSTLASTQIGLSGEADLRHGVALLTFGVAYVTDAGQPHA